MGYTTDFDGSIAIEPPLNEAEITYLRSGRIEAQGEDPDDRWGLVVNGDEVTVEKYAVVKADAPHDCPSCQCEGGGR